MEDIMKLPVNEMPCKLIWLADGGKNDEYVDFYPDITLLPGRNYTLRIAADTDYNIFIDGVLFGFGQYSDDPDRLIYDEYSPRADRPSNLKITAWHSGIDSQCHKKHKAYIAFALFENGTPVPGGCSGEHILSSLSLSYAQHRCRIITGQLGAGFGTISPLSSRHPEEAKAGTRRHSEEVDLELSAVLPRPNRKLEFGKAIEGMLVKTGCFSAPIELVNDPAMMMTKAVLSDSCETPLSACKPGEDISVTAGTCSTPETGSKPGNGSAKNSSTNALSSGSAPEAASAAAIAPESLMTGHYYIFDLGAETVGYPRISFSSNDEPVMLAGWGEHLTDGICRTVIGSRRFAFDYFGNAGANICEPSFRRLGCRYIQLFISGSPGDVKLNFLPVDYPVGIIPSGFDLSDPKEALRERIRSTAIHTLRSCMHEHYEDCPWREQSLYTLDSRNQMLAGYSVFEDGNREMVRSSLDLMSRGIRPDGIMQLCFPAGLDYPIPFYSLAWFVQFDEYLSFTNDIPFALEKLPVLTRLAETILSRRIDAGEKAGLCPRYPESQRIWNFYEWSESMSGSKYNADELDPPAEAPFNASLVIALRALADICERAAANKENAPEGPSEPAGEPSAADYYRLAEAYKNTVESVREALRRVFLRPDGFFRSFTDRDTAPLTVLTQALCILAGACDESSPEERERIAEIILKNDPETGFVPATLSMACFRYDALLMLGGDRYAEDVLDEIDRDGSYMLDRDATTFWETIKGDADFSNAGSLCHGWSAMSAYYYDKLLGK